MNIVQTAKDHPYLTAAGVFVGGVFLVIILSSGTKAEAVEEPSLGGFQPYDPNAAASNAALVQSSMSAQIAARQSDNELAAVANSNEAAFMIANAQFQTQSNADVLAARVAFRAFESQDRETQALQTIKLGEQSTVRHEIDAFAGVERLGIEQQAQTTQYLAKTAAQTARAIASTEATTARYITDRTATMNERIKSTEADVAKTVSNNTMNTATTLSHHQMTVALSRPPQIQVAPPAPVVQSGPKYSTLTDAQIRHLHNTLDSSIIQGDGNIGRPERARAAAAYLSNWQRADTLI